MQLVTDASTGEFLQRIEYDEFGRVLADSAPELQPFGFAGGLYDEVTKLLRFGARDYSAEVGRWIARDPVRLPTGDMNPYLYAEGDPIGLVDALGFCGTVNGIGRAAAAIGAFGRNYKDLRDANTIGADKYFHCKANCEATRLGCEDLAKAISDAREWTDENLKDDPPSACEEDQKANSWGRQKANSQQNCSRVCSPFRPNGLSSRY